jgi:hypothetical protein
MVHKGPRPAYRRATAGPAWTRFRRRVLAEATNCAYCQAPFVTGAPCTHPSHAAMGGCPAHPQYPTVEHVESLVHGGAARDPGNALPVCNRCNSTRGATTRRVVTKSRHW